MNSAYLLGLVSDKVRTVQVTFEPKGKRYTYLTILEDLKEGQDVLVEVGNEINSHGAFALKAATVASVDEGVNIEPHSQIKYRWAVSTLGTTAREKQAELQELEAKVVSLLQKAERSRRRKLLSEELQQTFGAEALKEAQSLILPASAGNGLD